MSCRPAPSYTARQLHEFAASYIGDSDWYKWRATQTRDPREAERDLRIAGLLEAKGNGSRFRARKMAYYANGGRK